MIAVKYKANRMEGKDADTGFAPDKESSNQTSYGSNLAVWGPSGQEEEGSVGFLPQLVNSLLSL